MFKRKEHVIVIELYQSHVSAGYRLIISEYSQYEEKNVDPSRLLAKAGHSATRILLAVENTSKLFTIYCNYLNLLRPLSD